MNEMAKRKALSNNRNNRNQSTINSINRIRPNLTGSNLNTLKGASSGLKTKNKYLADFEKLKASLTSKKGDSNILIVSSSYSRNTFNAQPSKFHIASNNLDGHLNFTLHQII